jgi:indole-3-glycerol phosphate synthase
LLLNYAQNGASAISILTDEQYFGGTINDVLQVVGTIQTPILRKEFIIDEIQIIEAKAIGADLILLIAACLTPQQVLTLAKFAKTLQLEVLLEIHNEYELQHINEYIDFVGVNNRNLKDFAVNLDHSIALCNKIPEQFIKVAESGIGSATDINYLAKEGFNAFLIGEMLMKKNNPGLALQQLFNEYKLLQNG